MHAGEFTVLAGAHGFITMRTKFTTTAKTDSLERHYFVSIVSFALIVMKQ
jgi:hypothetical protein